MRQCLGCELPCSRHSRLWTTRSSRWATHLGLHRAPTDIVVCMLCLACAALPAWYACTWLCWVSLLNLVPDLLEVAARHTSAMPECVSLACRWQSCRGPGTQPSLRLQSGGRCWLSSNRTWLYCRYSPVQDCLCMSHLNCLSSRTWLQYRYRVCLARNHHEWWFACMSPAASDCNYPHLCTCCLPACSAHLRQH